MANAEQPMILVIDDERGPRESLRILLKNQYNVLCADSVDGGVQMLEQHEPDAVIMDIRMPVKTGIEGLRDIRAIDPNVSVIMLTGFGSLETAQEAIRLGANDYLKKPFDAREMEEVIGRNVQRTRLERRRWRTEKDLKLLNEQLSDELAGKQNMAELGQKSAELVHDLRSPLTAVMGYVELLADELRSCREQMGDRWSETAEYLEMIEKSALRCKEMTDMWLSLSRKDPQRMQPVPIGELVRDVIRTVDPQATKRGVRLELSEGCGSSEIAADQLQIVRAIQNVVVNAIEASPEQCGFVRVSCAIRGDVVEVLVADNGCGMNQEQILHAFDPFFTTKKLNGTGLGLFITKKVIEGHRGTIHLQSRPAVGTLVSIRFPLLDRPEVAIA